MGYSIKYLKTNDTFKEKMGLEIWQTLFLQKANWK